MFNCYRHPLKKSENFSPLMRGNLNLDFFSEELGENLRKGSML